MPVSKTDAHAGTLTGRWKAIKRRWRDRQAHRIEAERIEAEDRRERLKAFLERARRYH